MGEEDLFGCHTGTFVEATNATSEAISKIESDMFFIILE